MTNKYLVFKPDKEMEIVETIDMKVELAAGLPSRSYVYCQHFKTWWYYKSTKHPAIIHEDRVPNAYRLLALLEV